MLKTNLITRDLQYFSKTQRCNFQRQRQFTKDKDAKDKSDVFLMLWNYNWIISLKVQCSHRLKFKCHCSASRTGAKQNGYVNSEAIYNPINSQIHSSIIWNVLILTNSKELGLQGLFIFQ